MKKEIQVNKPSDIYELEEVQEIKNAIQGHLLLIGLDRKNNILNISLIGIGNGWNIKIDTKYIVRTALITGCDSVILVHNHPANSLVPSKEDKHLTNYTKKVLEAFNIQLMDHIIVVERGYSSMKKMEVINNEYEDEKTSIIEKVFLMEENKRLKEELEILNNKLLEEELEL